MGRSRPKNRKTQPVVTESITISENSQAPSVSALLEKTQALIVQCDYNLANKFVRRVLERDSNNAEAKEMLGVIQLEIGELEAAKQVRMSVLIARSSIYRVLTYIYRPF